MGHIQQGDTRQYFSKHEGVIDTTGQYANMINKGIQSGVSITQKANESTMASNQIDLSTRFLAENNKINTKYQADPTNPQREVELRQAFDSLASQYKINPVCEKQWADIKTNVYDRYKTYNAQWVEKQQQSNISTNLKNGYENLTNQISMLGLNGAGVDEMRLVYANGIEGLRNGAVAGLGEVVVNDFLKDSNHDIMTTYLSALALNNPLEAQRLLKDEGVRNDIGRAETLQKLDDYVANSLSNQAKRTAVNELGNTLRGMNSEEANNIINGKADLNKVMKFIESNKNLPEGSKDLILGIYGISSKTDYYYDRDKKKIVKDPEGGSRRSGSRVAGTKMTVLDKKLCAEQLEQDLHNLISFSTDNSGNLNVKEIKKGKNQQQASDSLIGYMRNVAGMQERIDTAYHTGAITKDDRNRMMKQYIAPVTDYLDSNLEQLDEKRFKFAGQKLGYDKIKQRFNTDGLKGDELRSMQKQKLFAQNYYLDELYKASKKLGLKNIYDIEGLNTLQQQEIYKTASDNALLRAKRWTDEPEIFFTKEYPDIALQPSVYFKANEAKIINHVVAEAVYKRAYENADGSSQLDDLKDYAQLKCKEEIMKKYKENQIRANQTMGALKTGDYRLHSPLPKNYGELENELKNMGYTVKDFHQFAVENGYVEPMNNNQWRQGGYLNKWYMNALLDLRQAKSIKNKGKK